MGLTRQDLERWIRTFAQQVISEHQALSDLDAATGDADHGSNLERGLSSLLTVLDDWDDDGSPAAFVKDVGMHLVSSVGGSSGALYGTMFLRMARAIGSADLVDNKTLVAAWEGAVEGIVERGNVSVGDKTMLDALDPAVRALRDGLDDQGLSRTQAIEAAAAAARDGRDATADMVARRGKSSYAREKSRGVVDAGAASVTMLVEAAAAELAD